MGTPDEDAYGESDDEARSKRALSQRLLNHVNGDGKSSFWTTTSLSSS